MSKLFSGLFLISVALQFDFSASAVLSRPSLARRVLLPVLAATFHWSSSPALGSGPAAASDLRGLARFEAVRTDLRKLDAEWDQVVAKRGGGDGVRRVLGTVYAPPKCEAALCGWDTFIGKFVRSPEATDKLDLSEFDTPSLTLQQAVVQADFLAYSAGFADYGNGGGGQELLEQSHKQVQVALVALDELIRVVSAK